MALSVVQSIEEVRCEWEGRTIRLIPNFSGDGRSGLADVDAARQLLC